MWIMKLTFFYDSIQIRAYVVGADLWKGILMCVCLGYNIGETM